MTQKIAQFGLGDDRYVFGDGRFEPTQIQIRTWSDFQNQN
jgi:hypothetical protein